MSKKKKHHKSPVLSGPQLKERLQRALEEERSQSALDYAKQLHKLEPTPGHVELLKCAYLLRAEQLLTQGANEDAGNVLSVAMELAPSESAWIEKIAPLMARAGRGAKAIALLEKVPESAQSESIYQAVADNAVVKGQSARDTLPERVRADFDRVLQAFALLEKGRDEECRSALQGIGLRSPFAEWKLMLRGLLAYYQGEDARAIENWQRLDAHRVPARLIAPLRVGIDPSFLERQTPQAREHLQNQARRLEGPSLAGTLRIARENFAHRGKRREGYRRIESIATTMKQEAPGLWARLKQLIYWNMPEGQPEEREQFKKIFGTVPEDPNLTRLFAFAADAWGHRRSSIAAWKEYEAELQRDPARWGPEINDRIRAMIWTEIGRIRMELDREGDSPEDMALMGEAEGLLDTTAPSVSECFQRAQNLAPELLIAYVGEIGHHFESDDLDQAEKAALRLLEHFPEHDTTLRLLANMYIRKKTKLAKAIDYLQQALTRNPLDQTLRNQLGVAYQTRARDDTKAKRFDKAREGFEAALSYLNPRETFPTLCQWSALEFLAGDNARAEELLQQAENRSQSALAVSYRLLVDSIVLKLPAALKKRFDADFKARLKVIPSPADVSAVAFLMQWHAAANLNYHGQKTHEKSLRGWLERAPVDRFGEQDLVNVCRALVDQGVKELPRRFASVGETRFPQNPHFPLCQALTYMDKGRWTTQWPVSRLLNNALERARALPSNNPERALLIETIEGHLESFDEQFPYAAGFRRMGGLFGGFGGGFGFYDDDDDDDDDGW